MQRSSHLQKSLSIKKSSDFHPNVDSIKNSVKMKYTAMSTVKWNTSIKLLPSKRFSIKNVQAMVNVIQCLHEKQASNHFHFKVFSMKNVQAMVNAIQCQHHKGNNCHFKVISMKHFHMKCKHQIISLKNVQAMVNAIQCRPHHNGDNFH